MEPEAQDLLMDSDHYHSREKYILQDRLMDKKNFSVHCDLKDSC